MYSPEAGRRRNALIAVVLVALLLLSAGFIFYLYGEWSVASSNLTQYYWQSQYLNMTIQQMNATTPKVTVTLKFTPTPPAKTVKPNTITFLTGYLTVTNLTEIYTPATLTANFTVTHTTTNPNATIEYSWIPFQTVQLLKGIEAVEVPWGAWPIVVGSQPSEFTLFITIQVQIFWEPVHALMADQTITGQFKILVEE